MTSRERIEFALKHTEPDRTPIFDYILLSPVADELLGHVYIDYAGDAQTDKWIDMAREIGWEKAVRRYATDRVMLAATLEHDMMYVCPCPPEAALWKNEKCKAQPTSNEAGPVERMQRRNTAASQLPVLSEDHFLVYAYIKEESRKSDVDLPVLAPAYYHGVWTDVDLMQTMLLEPEVAHVHFSLATDFALMLIGRYIGAGVEMVGVGGDFAGNRPIISPKSYREFIVPEVRKLTDHLRLAGKYSVNASDGNLWNVIDDFLITCGVDGFLEIDSNAGMDLSRLKADYGSTITFFGNMDCGNTLSFGSPEEIRCQTLRCLESGRGNGGHVFCASNAITGSVPTENYLAMVNAYRELFSLPMFLL